MTDQLALLAPAARSVPSGPSGPSEPSGPDRRRSWELDEHTRDVGRQGIAAARRALRQASARVAA